jgi:hypothetical protein
MAVDLHKSSEKTGIQLKKQDVDIPRLSNMRVGVCYAGLRKVTGNK